MPENENQNPPANPDQNSGPKPTTTDNNEDPLAGAPEPANSPAKDTTPQPSTPNLIPEPPTPPAPTPDPKPEPVPPPPAPPVPLPDEPKVTETPNTDPIPKNNEPINPWPTPKVENKDFNLAGSNEPKMDTPEVEKPAPSPYPENLPKPAVPSTDNENLFNPSLESNFNPPPKMDNIFTGQAETPKSKLPMIIGIVIVLALLVTGGVFLIGGLGNKNSQVANEDLQPPKVTPAEEATAPTQSVFGQTILDSTPSAQ